MVMSVGNVLVANNMHHGSHVVTQGSMQLRRYLDPLQLFANFQASGFRVPERWTQDSPAQSPTARASVEKA